MKNALITSIGLVLVAIFSISIPRYLIWVLPFVVMANGELDQKVGRYSALFKSGWLRWRLV